MGTTENTARNDRACTQCGKCCTNPNYMSNLTADGKDVKRWRKEGREDILHYASVVGPPRDPWADLWIDDDIELDCCPFVRKIGKLHHCLIYDTRPQVCRDYVPWAPGSKCEEVP